MTEQSSATLNCPRCGVLTNKSSRHCWKCGAVLELRKNDESIVTAELVALAPAKTQPVVFNFGVATLLLITTLVAVCLALFAAAPGLGIVAAIIALPPLIRTIMLVQKKKSQGTPLPPSAKAGLFLGSFGVTVVIAVVTVFICLITFCLTCAGVLLMTEAANTRSSESLVFSMAALFTLLAFVLTLWLFSKWIRIRWKRDTK